MMGFFLRITACSAAVMSAAVLHAETAAIANERLVLSLDTQKRSIRVSDKKSGEIFLDRGWVAADGYGEKEAKIYPAPNMKKWHYAIRRENEPSGKTTSLVLDATYPDRPTVPVYHFRYTLSESVPYLQMSFGVTNRTGYPVRLRKIFPLHNATCLPGVALAGSFHLNGAAGSERTAVLRTNKREAANSLLLSGETPRGRRSIVYGGLKNRDFGKYVSLDKQQLSLRADDPVGRLVEPGETYWAEDTFYVGVLEPDPFVALEQYGLAMREANQASPNVYDFPLLCGWAVGALSKLPGVNNAEKLIGELDAAQKAGLTRYTKVGIRLEPDFYCYRHGNTEQGWWDDEHWLKFGHLVAPYDTMRKWCDAIRQRNGIPYTYFQVGMPSDDYARKFPGHMLFNRIDALNIAHRHHQPLVSFDYTDPDFQKHMTEVWQRLRRDGMGGVKFDYPETSWRPEGGFENKKVTAAFAYREAFRLAREGLGPAALLDERNLGENGRPRLDVTAGLVDTQRNWADSNKFTASMISIGGLRWYKNRVVFNYYPDSKTVHDCTPEIRRSMLTLVYLTSGRIELASSFTLFTPEITRDLTRLYPHYREAKTARPLDAFSGIADPQIYDFEISPDWHQVALFNARKQRGKVVLKLSGDPVAEGAMRLDPASEYYLYDFWNDKPIGRLKGNAAAEFELEPMHCIMLSVRKVQPNPQMVSTNRHIFQGHVETRDIAWDAENGILSGKADVIGGEPFRLVVANNGLMPTACEATGITAELQPHSAGKDYSVLELKSADSQKNAAWQIKFQK